MKKNLKIAKYKITLASSAVKEFNSLSKNIQKRLERAIDSLMTNPRPHGVVKLKGRKDIYRIRVGNYRVIYAIDDRKHLVDVSYLRHRSKAYFGLRCP